MTLFSTVTLFGLLYENLDLYFLCSVGTVTFALLLPWPVNARSLMSVSVEYDIFLFILVTKRKKAMGFALGSYVVKKSAPEGDVFMISGGKGNGSLPRKPTQPPSRLV